MIAVNAACLRYLVGVDVMVFVSVAVVGVDAIDAVFMEAVNAVINLSVAGINAVAGVSLPHFESDMSKALVGADDVLSVFVEDGCA